ncbi:hypothetical protein BC936DRAFT_143214 [Jimgerdemannia flammicorona]|uniref:Fungal-type protein kinase domain-containing protein n=1 Tax=Jimgerdemannia flammicorona TaxID=994334 RepID=A0A433DE49_9FUNG|nr:hypothetical protein BC936DRAFT_143214 [Jimgerdemannia flammicorona]
MAMVVCLLKWHHSTWDTRQTGAAPGHTEGHKLLFHNASILHHDVRWEIYTVRGVFIELDYAIPRNRLQAESANRTGTGPFMAIKVLEEKVHAIRLYVLLWIYVFGIRWAP